MKEESTSVIEEYERQIFDLRQLLEISKSLNSTLDYAILIDSILFTINISWLNIRWATTMRTGYCFTGYFMTTLTTIN